MLNIALGWAFLISSYASTGGKLMSAIIEPEALRQVPPYQNVLFSIFANYWIPALLIYLTLTAVRAGRFLKPSTGIHVLFGTANAILCVYAALRVLTSTVEGGGATFALASIGVFATVPALGGLAIATIWLVIRSVWHRADLIPREKLPSLKSAGSLVALVFLVPPVVFFSWMYSANAEKIHKAADTRRAKAARLDALCRTMAKAEVLRTAPRAKSVLFQLINNATYPTLEHVEFVELRNAYARSGEPGYQRMTKKAGQPVFMNGSLNVITEKVAEPAAEYEVTIRLLESKAETEQGIAVEEMTIRDRRSGDALANFVTVSERSSRVTGQTRFCGAGPDYVTYQRDATAFVLGLMDEKASTEFARRVAALKPVAN